MTQYSHLGNSANDQSLNHISSIAKRSLHKLMGCRQISIQEAVHHIAGMDLWICSDSIAYVSLGPAVYLRRRNKPPSAIELSKDLVKSYTYRSPSLENMSLSEYYYEKFRVNEFEKDKVTGRMKARILLPKGLNCRPRYPADYDYARGILTMHKPWSIRNPLKGLLDDKDETLRVFHSMMGGKEFPLPVLSEYNRAVTYSQEYRHQCLIKRAKNNENVDLDKLDEEELEAHVMWEHSRHLSAQNRLKLNQTLADQKVDLGIDHDWSTSFFKGQRANNLMRPDLYTSYLQEVFYGNDTEKTTRDLIIPLKKDGSTYELEDLNEEQQIVVLCAMEAIIKFLTNDPTYVPLRATIIGCGGTGKSFIINTLVSLIRNFTKTNDAVKVAAPSGGAAYNVGGCTLHRCLSLPVGNEKLSKDLSAEKQMELAAKLRNMLALIIDERSMISSMLMGGAERNVRHCSFGSQNRQESWAGIPVVLLFGDDFQLPPVIEEGAVEGFAKESSLYGQKPEKKPRDQQLLVNRGHDIFIHDLTQKVFHLRKNYRSKDDPEFKQILDNLRPGYPTKNDADRLMLQSLAHHANNTPFIDYLENHPKTIFLFTKNDEKNVKNERKLVNLAKATNNPVAMLKCQWRSARNSAEGPNSVYRHHFDKKTNVVEHTDLCVGATVAISGHNIVPEAGLFNGARGTIVDFVYDTVCGPNDKQNDFLPKAVIVDFPGFKHKDALPWDRNNPSVSQEIS